jgi:hypothetical protein
VQQDGAIEHLELWWATSGHRNCPAVPQMRYRVPFYEYSASVPMSLLTAGTDTHFTTELTHLHPRMGERRDVYGVLVGKSVGGEPLGRPRRRWEDNTKMDLREMGSEDTDWIELATDRDSWRDLVNAAMNFRAPYNAGNFLTSWGSPGFTGRTLLRGVGTVVTMSSLHHHELGVEILIYDDVHGVKVNESMVQKEWVWQPHLASYSPTRNEDFSFTKTINYRRLTAALTNS